MLRQLPWMLAVLVCAGAARAQDMKIAVLPDSLAADSSSRWKAEIRIENASGVGLYLDSLQLVIVDGGPGQTRIEREARRPLSLLSTALSAGESSQQSFSAVASVDQGTLRVLAWGHDHEGRPRHAEATAAIVPTPFSRAHPSRFVERPAGRVEYIFVPAESARGPAPAVLLIHGHANQARGFLPLAAELSARGFAVMAVSQPGYGLSGGQADFMGPATIDALSDAFDQLRRQPGVDPKRIAAWGVSRGATCAVGLALRRPEVAAVVAQAGSYDLWATYRECRIPGIRENIVAEVGSDSAAWRERSPLLRADRLRCPVLLLHGVLDENVPVGPARALQAALEKSGRPVEAKYFERSGHFMPRAEVVRLSLLFLERRLKS